MADETTLANPPQYRSVKFELDADQIARLNVWLVEVNKRASEKQAGTQFGQMASKVNILLPDYGAIGGGITFSFTGTGLGIVCKVKESITGEEIDLSDYENW